MRATMIYGAGDVRGESGPDPVLREPTDALPRAVASCNDLWPHGSRPATDHGDRIGHKFLGRIEPGKVFGRTVALDQTPDGYRAVADRTALKVLIRP